MTKPKGSLISYFSRKVTQSGGINLAQGKPGFTPPTELLDILHQKITDYPLHQYAPGNGNFQLLSLLVEHYRQIKPVSEKNFLITQGATEGIFLCFFYLSKILQRPFSVLSFDPVYESYSKLPEIFAIPFKAMALNPDLSVDFGGFEKTVKKSNVGIVFIASPGNPLGKIWQESELRELLSLADKYGFYVVFDAVYKDIFYHTSPPNPLKFAHEKLFYVNSFSKMLSITGWRIGYLIAPEGHMAKIRDIHDYTGLSAVALFQQVIYEYLDKFLYGKNYLQSVRKQCKKNSLYLKNELETSGFEVPDIQGGYFLWTKLPDHFRDGFRFAKNLLESEQVAIVPGENFSTVHKNFVRINIATRFKNVVTAAKKINNFIKQTKSDSKPD